jgi:hypothetical protein
MKRRIIGIAVLLAFNSCLAAEPALPRPKPVPAETPPPPEKLKCPESVDCMPGGGDERAARCAWVKKHCPDTKILQ